MNMAEQYLSTRTLFINLIYILLVYLIKNSIAVTKKKDLCILNIGDSTLNLNLLKNPDGYEIIHGNRKFLLNICDSISRYGQQNISASEIDTKTGNIKQVLGYINNLSILPSYKPIPALKYQTSGKKKNRNVVEIQFKCNQRLRQHKITLLGPQTGKKYKFLFESKMVCIDRNMKCVVQHVNNNIQYDLNSLYKPSSNWEVQNTTNKFFLNMCGSLHQISSKRNRECSFEDTQVCLVDAQNHVSKSLGIVSSDFSTTDNMVSITFKDGSLCNQNSTIETTIDFYCSFNEHGPQLISTSLCNYNIIWNTPAACPNFVSNGVNCQIYDPFFGSRDMRTIFPESDTTKQITNDISISYNLCNNLFTPCGYFNNASVCLFYKNTENVLAWANNKIESKNGHMSMKLSGDNCITDSKQISTVVVNYLCRANMKNYDVINLSQDMCKTEINIYTNLACVENNDYSDCILNSNGKKYDLRPLISNLSNYEILDKNNQNIKYFINVCRPLIFKNDVFCNRYSSVCMKNSSEPNLTKRFKTLGSFTSSSVPFIENNKLTIRYYSGVCRNQNSSHTSVSTDIIFICNKQETKPVLKFKDECYFQFEWRSIHACSISI